MQINPFDQYYIGQLVIQCWLKTFSLASEDKNDAGSKTFCCNSENINSDDRALKYIGLFGRNCIR